MVRAVLWIDVLAWAGFGVWLSVMPEALAGAGLDPDTAMGRVEVRGFYGGLELGIAAFLWWTTRAPQRYRAGLMLGLLSLGGLATGRLLGMAIEGQVMPLMVGLMAVEYGGAAANAWALTRLRATG